MPSRPVRVVTQGPSDPVRVVTNGPSDPVRVISGYPSDPVRVVTSGISTPVRIVEGSLDTIGDGLRSDAVAYWKLDEVSGTRVDETGHGHDLYEQDGSIVSVAGKIGDAVNFFVDENGSPYLANSDTYNLQDFSVVFWFRIPVFSEVGNMTTYLLELGSIVSDRISLEARVNPLVNPNTFILSGYANSVGGEGDEDEAHVSITVNFTDWHMGRIWREGGTLYVAADDGIPATNLGGTILDVGIDFGGSFVGIFNLYMDEYGLWNRALSNDEFDYLWNGGAGRALFP